MRAGEWLQCRHRTATFTLIQQRSIQPRQDVHISIKHVTIFICHRLFSTFRKLHLYVHKTVQKHGITSILSYINIPTFRITTRFSLAKTYFQGNCLCTRWTVEKRWNVQSISVPSGGSGTLNRTKTSKQFLPIIFGIHAKNRRPQNSRLGVVRIYVH